MAVYDFARAGAARQQMASSPGNRSVFPYERQRTRSRGALGVIGTLLVLMGVAMGVLTIRFMLVVAHTVLQ